MRRLLLALTLAILPAACGSPPAPDSGTAATRAPDAPAAAADAAFATLAQRVLDSWMQFWPVAATQMGDHRFDALLDDLGAEGRAALLDGNRALLAQLQSIDIHALSRENQVDA